MSLQTILRRLEHGVGGEKVMPGLDGLRALAVTMVVIFHIYGFGAGSPTITVSLGSWLSTGHVGVYLFFSLSGFLLMLPWAKRYHLGPPPPSANVFFTRRILRIVPAYYAHLFVLFFILVPLLAPSARLFSPIWVINFFAHMGFLQYLSPWTSASFGVNGALWTLTIEACFYLLLPVIAPLFLGRRAPIGLALAFVVTQGWHYLSFHHLYDLADLLIQSLYPIRYESNNIKIFIALQFPGQLFYFACGMAVANIAVLPKKLPSWYLTYSSTCTLVALAAMLILLRTLSQVDFWGSIWLYVWPPITAVTLSMLVLSVAIGNSVSRVLFEAPIWRILGLTSYSTYLWHIPVILVVKRYLTPPGLLGAPLFGHLLATCIPITLCIALLSYIYIELPFLRHRNRGLKPNPCCI